MKSGCVLLLVATTLLLATFTLRAQPAATPALYLGSEQCQRCHQPAYDKWKQSLHIHMTKPIAAATVVGDFTNGARFSDHGRSYEFGRKDGTPFVRIASGDRPPETFPVEYTLGFKRYQGYMSTLPDGRMYVLPIFWQVESRRWLDWKELAPVPDGAHDLRQIWNVNCFNCHATNLAQGFNIANRKYETRWSEMGIGCEACHGPGSDHVALMDTLAKDRTLKPPFDIKIFSPRRASTREVFDTCAYCHGNKTNIFTGFRAGSRYEDYALPFLLSTPIPDNDLQGEFWPDGRPNRFNRPQAVMQSGCFASGQLACTSCHVAHGSSNPFSLKFDVTAGAAGDQLCTQCHSGAAKTRAPAVAAAFQGAGLARHTFHKAESAGSRCINCHMSDVNWRLLIRRRDHTYKPPVPEMTTAFGVPNACTTCHDDRSPEWAATQMDAWWGDGSRRKAVVAVATVMYRAGSHDTTVASDLARLAVDRTQSAFTRASAAEYLSNFLIEAREGVDAAAPVQSQTSFGSTARARTPQVGAPVEPTPAIVNALIGAASDPEAVVRAEAVRGLATAPDQERILSALTARLVDPARVVRARTAEVLIAFGITSLPGAAGVALVRAQDEYADSLRMFPDVAANHTNVAWLEAQRGRLPAAISAADDALKVDPRAARPWVIKGVIAAREGKYGEAIENWKKARSLEPSYPNIDRLISEAEKRK
jgi:predicted CXXCH cytochrome family protein